MSGMLASVNCLADAQRVQQLGVAIIDLKQPEHGALGALECDMVRAIVQALPAEAVISATVGDLPMQPDVLVAAVQQMADTGVDYIKLGFFPDGDAAACVKALQPVAQQHALIAVLFADQAIDSVLVPQLAAAGFAGVMLDTQHKHNGHLLQHLSLDALQAFVANAKAMSLLVGLAGSLTLDCIPSLLPLQADYLGFRGALCRNHQRTAALDDSRVRKIQQVLAGL